MRAQKLREIIDDGESTTVEFKRKATSPYKLAREISAFANTKGGYLIVGVDDDGSIVGVRSEKSEIDIIETACLFHIEPPVDYRLDIVSILHWDVIVVYIPQSKNKPHKLTLEDKTTLKKYKRAFIRIGEKSIVASREMSRLLQYQREDAEPLLLSIGDKEKRLFRFLEKYEKITVKDYAKLVNISRRRAERMMISLVRAGILQIHNDNSFDYFTLV